MISTKKFIVAFIVLLVAHLKIYAQYNGGNADGSSLNILSPNVCSTPSNFFPYMGGSGDGEGVNTKIYATCATTPGQFAYMGGVSDGESVDTKSYTTCGYAPGAYAYMGGKNDGAYVDTKMYQNCPYPPQFYAYFGGSGDGSSMHKLQNCAIVLPTAAFSGNSLEICQNQTVTFTDASTNAVAWEWTVTGGTFVSPTTMYSQNPVVKYTTAGTYAVTLKARNIDGDNILTKTAYIKVNTLATVDATTPGSRCGTGSVIIGATPNSGTIHWYATATGGTSLGSGTTWNTPSISTTTTYYAEANNGCVSAARTAVTATINPVPSMTGNNSSRCGTGTVTISVNPSIGGTVKWYDSATGGTELATGTIYTTPSISATTDYYAEVTTSVGCSSGRIKVTATVNEIPTITSTTPATRCGAGTATISATASAGSINWYDSATGGTWLASGSSFSPNVGVTTTYYVGTTTTAGCNSTRTPVTITVNAVPSITSTTPASRCGTGTVTLAATASSGTISWFANATGGTALGTGTTFTTPNISTSTTYYVETDNGTCNSGRTAVTATVNSTSAPTGSATQTLCGTKTLADLSVVGSNIIWYDSATGGNVLPNSTTIIYGNTYYASQTLNNCESETRLAITPVNTGCLGTNESSAEDIRVYPVPVTDILYIDSKTEKIISIEVYAQTGQKILTKNSIKSGSVETIDFKNYPTASYLVRIIMENKVKTVKVIKK